MWRTLERPFTELSKRRNEIMKPFLSEDFLLGGEVARALFHEFANPMPIFDYHTHLPVEDIANDRRFENMTQLWLSWDHYKWRAMRASGVPEDLITGKAPDEQKFMAWAETLPRLLGNPLFHWTHLELKRYFGISGKILCQDTASEIYRTCNELLKEKDFSARNLVARMKVKVLFTTEDPTSDLRFHKILREDKGFSVAVVPTFRPDGAMAVDRPEFFASWIKKLEESAQQEVVNYSSFLQALEKRHESFHEMGCRSSDHALERPYAEEFTQREVERIFEKARKGEKLSQQEKDKFRTSVLIELCKMNSKRGWVQQFHIGAIRNLNSKGFKLLGADAGYDAIGDQPLARDLARFLDILDGADVLAKTILYAMNPRDAEVMLTVAGCFQEGTTPGKIQLGPPWWFNDQEHGIRHQLRLVASMGVLGVFVGMVTDSRSFLSFPRHEYFRRILCDEVGREVERGNLPKDESFLGEFIRAICYDNARKYFETEAKEL